MAEKVYTADLEPLRRFDVGPFTVHNEWGNVINDDRWERSDNTFPLLRMLLADPNLDLLSTAQRAKDREKNFSWVFTNTTRPGNGLVLPGSGQYFEALNPLIQPYGMSLRDSLFSNMKVVNGRNNELVLGGVALFNDRVSITNKDNYTFASDKPVGISLNLTPPTLRELRDEDFEYSQYEYFSDTIRLHILSALALAECISGKRANTGADILMTGDDTTYRYDEDAGVGTPARERISLGGTATNTAMTEPNEAKTGTVSSEQNDLFSEVDVEPRVSISDIAGPRHLHDKLTEIAYAYRNPEALKKWGVRKPQGVLLYGPPGTGKSMVAEALATEIGGELWEIRAGDLADKWLGNTEKNMQKLFDEAKAKATPTVMFWNEIDSLVGEVGSSGGSADRALEAARGVFKRETEKLGSVAPNVLLVAATNNLDKIGDALIRAGRFDEKVYMGLPDESARLQLFASKIAEIMHTYETEDNRLYAPDLDVSRLATLTDEWSGAEIVEVLRRTQMKKAVAEMKRQQVTPISQGDLETEIRLFGSQRQ